MPDNIRKSFAVGFKRRWKAALLKAFGAIGAIWTITEIVTKISKTADQWIDDNNVYYSLVIFSVAFICFAYNIYETRVVSFFIPTTDIEITIRFGDLFEQKTNWIIGVNEFFDSKIGNVVAQNSLHGQFITKIFNGNETQFRSAVDVALLGIRCTSTPRLIEPRSKYEIGTTAVISNGPYKAFLVALSQTDLQTAKASSTVPLLWVAVNGALEAVHNYGNDTPLSIPLLGNGRSSVNIEPQHLMRLIILALVNFGRKRDLPKKITVVAHEDCFEKLDIKEIKRDWSKE